MAKKWRKQKARTQVKKRRKAAPGAGDANSAGGTLGGFRKVTRGFFSGKQSAKSTGAAKLLDWALWAAVGVVGFVLLSSRCHH